MKAKETKLSNGLRVVYLAVPDSHFSKLILQVPVGAIHDPEHKQGLSHILEHTFFCGTRNTSEKELLDRLRALGGGYGAWTGSDETNYELTASAHDSDNFSQMADIMRELITEPAFNHARVEIEKRVVINEKADAMDNLTRNPSVELDRAMYSGNQRYADIIGSVESISSITSNDLHRFMTENYDAGQMTLYAAAPMDFDSAVSILEQTMSGLPNLGLPPKDKYQIVCSDADIRRTRDDLLQNYTTFMFATPSAQTLRDFLVQAEAGKLLKDLLPETLRSRYGCFYAVEFGTWNTSPRTSVYNLSMSNTPEDSANACTGLQEYVEQIDSIMTDGAIEGALKSAAFMYSEPRRIDADMLGFVHVQDQLYDILFDMDEVRKTIETITPDEIRGRMREIAGSLAGLYVQGPEPSRLPPLQDLQVAFSAGTTKEPVPLRSQLPPGVTPRLEM